MKREQLDEREDRDETIAILNDEELMNKIRQGLNLLKKNKALSCAMEEL
jgi:hypothetical protein